MVALADDRRLSLNCWHSKLKVRSPAATAATLNPTSHRFTLLLRPPPPQQRHPHAAGRPYSHPSAFGLYGLFLGQYEVEIAQNGCQHQFHLQLRQRQADTAAAAASQGQIFIRRELTLPKTVTV